MPYKNYSPISQRSVNDTHSVLITILILAVMLNIGFRMQLSWELTHVRLQVQENSLRIGVLERALGIPTPPSEARFNSIYGRK